MARQSLVVSAMLLLGLIAIGTGSVLLIGYAIAAFSFAAIVYVGFRKLTKRVLNSRPVLRRSGTRRAVPEFKESTTRRAA